MTGYIDTWGRGTLKIYNSCREHGLPEPAILEKDGGFMVVLYKTKQATDTGGQVGSQVSSPIGSLIGSPIDNLTDRQKEVLLLIIDDPKISRKQLSGKLGINESAVQKHTNALKKKGVIERESQTTGQ